MNIIPVNKIDMCTDDWNIKPNNLFDDDLN